MKSGRLLPGACIGLMLLIAGCGGAVKPPVIEPPLARPECAATATRGEPRVCTAPNGDMFVVGLTANHGLTSKQWVALEVREPERPTRIAAVALVERVGSDFAKIS